MELLSTDMEQLLSQTVTGHAMTILVECAEVTGKTPYTEQNEGVDHFVKGQTQHHRSLTRYE